MPPSLLWRGREIGRVACSCGGGVVKDKVGYNGPRCNPVVGEFSENCFISKLAQKSYLLVPQRKFADDMIVVRTRYSGVHYLRLSLSLIFASQISWECQVGL
jgi:hypothetical protein